MEFDRESVRAHAEGLKGHGGGCRERKGFGIDRGKCGRGDGTLREVVAEDFRPVEVEDGTVVDCVAEPERFEVSEVGGGHFEFGFEVIGGDVRVVESREGEDGSRGEAHGARFVGKGARAFLPWGIGRVDGVRPIRSGIAARFVESPALIHRDDFGDGGWRGQGSVREIGDARGAALLGGNCPVGVWSAGGVGCAFGHGPARAIGGERPWGGIEEFEFVHHASALIDEAEAFARVGE